MRPKMAKLFGHMFSKKHKQSIDGGKIPVLVYDISKEGNDSKHVFEPDEKCEDVCRKLAKIHNLTPVMLHCFSLAAFSDHGPCCFWLGPYDKLGDHSQWTIHFRMRFLPAIDKCDQMKTLDTECLCYLFWQVKWDFIHDKIEFYTDKDKQESSRGVIVLCILILLRRETELTNSGDENVNAFLERNSFRQFVPKSLLDDCNFIDEKVQRKHMVKKVDEYKTTYPNGSKVLMEAYIKNMLKEDKKSKTQFYYVERYSASTKSNKEMDLKLAIQMDCPVPQVHITDTNNDTVFSANIDDLTMLEMKAESDMYTVTILKYANCQNIYFQRRLEAVSFLTCLETLYRLTHAFDCSLCPQQLEPTDVKSLKKIRAHGPVSNQAVIQKLKRREKRHNSGSKENVYILRASPKDFDVFEVLYKDERTGELHIVSLGKIERRGQLYVRERRGQLYVREGSYLEGELKALILEAMKENASTVVPWQRLPAPSEVCDTLQNILQDKTEENDEAEDNDKEPETKVYTDSSLKLLKLIGQGHFTETYEAVLNKKEMVVVKRLRCSEIPDHSFRPLLESFHDSCDKLLELRNPKYVVNFKGMALSRTPTLVMEMYKYGNLRSFLQSKEPRENQLTLRHLCDVLLQLAKALDEMNMSNLCHGNLHCDNLMVATFERNEMTVKIADPGLVTLYSKLKLDSSINKRRLPWMAPELYKNLFGVTLQSDMFAFGTTLWQMFSEGANPLDIDPALKNKSVEEIQQFFLRSDSCLSCPLYLRVRRDDSDSIKLLKTGLYGEVMKACWCPDPEKRIDPKTLLRNFNNLVQSHCTDYHDYNVIAEDYSVSSGINSGLSCYGSNYKGVASAIQTRKMPLADLEVLNRGKRIQNQAEFFPQTLAPTEQRPSPEQGTRQMFPSNQAATNQGRVEPVNQAQANPWTLRNGHSVQLPGQLPVNIGKRAQPNNMGTRDLPRITSPLPVKDVKHLIAEDRLTVHVDKTVGQGHYGKIFIGTLAPTSNLGLHQPTKVAVKVLKQDIVSDYGKEFIDEAKVMEGLDHKNIVKFYGVCRNGEYLVMEYVDNGSLYMFVKNEGDRCASDTLLKFCVDIAAGMEYLSLKKVLHRDLAARNILITQSLDAKVSDFGMSLVLEKDRDYYRRDRNVDKNVPVLWSAPEWIGKKVFTTKSDVWSFGVVLWEVYSKGRLPNICKDLNEFRRRGVQMIMEGHRLQCPSQCGPEVYTIMKQCWQDDREKRPSFTECHARLREIAGMSDSDNDSEEGDNRVDYSRGNEQNKLVPNTAPSSPPFTNTNIIEELYSRNRIVMNNSTAPPIVNPRSTIPNGAVASVPVLPSSISRSSMQMQCFLDKSKLKVENEKKLGEGAFGAVFRGQYEGRQVAVKRCTKENEYKRFRREIDLLSGLSQGNIVEFVGFVDNCFEAGGKLELVMEYMGLGNLHSYLIRSKASPPSLSTKLGVLIDVAEAMSYLYTRRVLHCDLTASNVLLCGTPDDFTAKVSDFGWAKKLDTYDDDSTYRRSDAQFKAHWTAIEVLCRCIYTPYTDIWSYGCVAIEVFGDGKVPDFDPSLGTTKDDNITVKLLDRVRKGDRFARPEHCPQDMYTNILLKCWETEPSHRIKFDQILSELQRERTINES